MSRRGNICEEARQGVFDYVEIFYKPVRKQVGNGVLSPAEFERQQISKAECRQKSRGYSELHPPARSRTNQGWHRLQRKPEPGISRDHAPASSPFSIALPLISPRTLRQNPFA